MFIINVLKEGVWEANVVMFLTLEEIELDWKYSNKKLEVWKCGENSGFICDYFFILFDIISTIKNVWQPLINLEMNNCYINQRLPIVLYLNGSLNSMAPLGIYHKCFRFSDLQYTNSNL